MTRPDEIAALADELERDALHDGHSSDAWVNHCTRVHKAVAALRASATSPGDAVREAKEVIAGLQHAASNRSDRLQQTAAIDRATVFIWKHLIALAPAEKAGDGKVTENLGRWLSAALDDPQVCQEMKDDILAWMNAGMPNVQPAATPTPPSPDVAAKIMAAIAPCKGEQYKFEEWAKSRHYDMSEHPLHYLFLDPKTNGARNGWKAALEYVEQLIQSAAPGGGTKSDGSGSPVADNPDDSTASACSKERPRPAVSGTAQSAHGELSDAGNVVEPQAAPDRASRVPPGPSDPAQEPEAVAAVQWLHHDPIGGFPVWKENQFWNGVKSSTSRNLYTRPVSLDREEYAQGVRDANQLVGCLWVDLFNKDMVKAAGADFFDDWRARILALIEGRT